MKDLTLSDESIRAKCQLQSRLHVSAYNNDQVAHKPVSEFSEFHRHCHSHADSKFKTSWEVSLLIADGDHSVFPNVEVAPRIYLSLMASKATALERDHSRD